MRLIIVCMLVCPSFINASCIRFFCDACVTCNHNHSLNLDVSNITVHFYDHTNNTETMFPIYNASNRILSLPALNKTYQFFVYVGGFTSHIDDKSTLQIRKAFKSLGTNSYLLIFDHSYYTYAKNPVKKYKDYGRSVNYVHYIGKLVGQVLAELSRRMIPPENIHCIGHSLGGHILGHVGSHFFSITKRKIARITALDPAGPCFNDAEEELQIRSGVAEYVEVYHCNDGVLGTSNILADADFFVNNGRTQPECPTAFWKRCMPTKQDSCSHTRCVGVWAMSVLKPKLFLAYKCKDYKLFKSGKCKNNSYRNAGFGNPGSARGVYYFSTKGIKF